MAERLSTMEALSKKEQLIQLSYMYGDSKEAIAKSCLQFAIDRKIYNGGIFYWDLKEHTNCLQFFA